MRRTIAIATATCMALLFAVTTSGAQGFDTKDRTFLTFSSAVELPGARLEAGTYLFKLADTAARNVVQVMTQDEKQMLGQWFFAPAQRQDVTDENVIAFRETSAGATPAIQYWYFPGEKTGKEFMYPKDQAMRIAKRTGVSVLTDEGRVEGDAQANVQVEQGNVADQRESEVGVVEGSGLPEPKPVATSGSNEQPAANAPASAPSESASSSSVRQESTVARNEAASQSELPQTSSPLVLGGLIALFSLAGAAGLRAIRR